MDSSSALVCDCGLRSGCKHPCIQPDTSGLRNGHCDVLIVGEAPGAEEDDQGTPFVGISGQLLRTIIEDCGLDEYGLAYTNVVRCRPPENAKPTNKQILACVPRLMAEIEQLNPKIVMLLGNVPLKAVLNETGITNWRGSKLERDGRIYLPVFHPAYILRSQSELPTMVKDFEQAYTLASGEESDHPQSVIDDYGTILVRDELAAQDMYLTIKRAGICSFDTETRNKYPYAKDGKCIMVSFAVNKQEKLAWAVLPIASSIRGYIRDILIDPSIKKIGHNVKFDQLVVKADWGYDVEGVIGDTMLQSYVLDVTPGRHGLKQLAGRYLMMYEYDKPLKDYHRTHKESDPERNGNNELVPVDIMWPYAAKDAIATLELHPKMWKEMEPKQRILYKQLLVPLSNAMFHIESNGVKLDEYIVRRYMRIYHSVQDKQMIAMLQHPMVKRLITDQQRALDKAFDLKHAGKKTRAKRSIFAFNPNSDMQMRKLLYGKRYFGLEPLGATDKGAPSTKWDYLKPYAGVVTPGAEAVEIGPVAEFLRYYHYHSLLNTMLSTFLGPALPRLGRDGRTRSTYSISGTVSGRLSSKEPNLQNIPTPEKEPGTLLEILPIKNIFTASDNDHLILAADYSGMELRTMASVSGCQGMMDIFENGEDLHKIVSARMFGIPIEEVTREIRYRGKWTNWTLLYGGSAYTLYRLYGIPLDQGKKFVKAYYGMFPEIRQYQEDTKEFARDHGYVESPFGLRRYLPYIKEKSGSKKAAAEREAVNQPIQNAASYILAMALIVLDTELHRLHMKSKIVNTVHDSLMMDVHRPELKIVARMMKDIMENIVTKYAPVWFPGLDVSWFICPLEIDLEVGTHYGSLKEYKEEEWE